MTKDLVIASCTLVTAFLNGTAYYNFGSENLGMLMSAILATISCVLSLNSFARNYSSPQTASAAPAGGVSN